jgi:hypothetical protein
MVVRGCLPSMTFKSVFTVAAILLLIVFPVGTLKNKRLSQKNL